MRLIGHISNENQARRMVLFLQNKGIESNCDIAFDTQTGQMVYHLWILDEDRIPEAAADFERFQKNPSDAEFDAPVVLQIDEAEGPQERADRPPERYGRSPLTVFLIGLCLAIFLFNGLEELPMRQKGLLEFFLFTPVQKALLYDLPAPFDALEQFLQKHPDILDQQEKDLAPEVRQDFQQIEKSPYWRGAYDWILLKAKGEDTSAVEGPVFSRIRQGEIWRLFSPCVLHTEFLHILFNMLWLWVLGRPIEQKIGILKTGLLTLGAGIGSNTIQYLISGPFFIGYSGVVMALAGFIWMRQKVAPWEGYSLNPTTMLFLLLFVGAMFFLTVFSFFFQLAANIAFAPTIANAAHIAGGVIGVVLGRWSFFSWRVAK